MKQKQGPDFDRGLKEDVVHELDVGPLARVDVRVGPTELEGLTHQEAAKDLEVGKISFEGVRGTPTIRKKSSL